MKTDRKTYHCIGCRNLPGYTRDVVDEFCCSCCRGENDERPGRNLRIEEDA